MSLFSYESKNPEIPPTKSGKPFTINIKIIRKRLSTIGRKKSVGPDGIPGGNFKVSQGNRDSVPREVAGYYDEQ